MSDSADTNDLFGRLPEGGKPARDALIAHTLERLRVRARQMLRGKFPRVRRWEETDDVLQNSVLRLCRALDAVQLGSLDHYYNLAAQQIRRELLDLADRHSGPLGVAANHHSDGAGDRTAGAVDPTGGPSSMADWADFHLFVDGLPEEVRAVFEMIWYFGLSQEETAARLGVSVRTVKRRWLEARLALSERFGGGLSES